MHKWEQKTVIFTMILSVVVSCSSVFAAEPPIGVSILKYDRPAGMNALPRNFRTAQSEFKKMPTNQVMTSREGLENLRLSGSSYFSKNEFREMLKQLPKNDLVILDLRAESHGYINEIGVSWYTAYKAVNRGMSAKQIGAVEMEALNAVLHKTIPVAILNDDKSIASKDALYADQVMTEKEFVESQGVRYYRIPVADYDAPSDANIDRFLKFYRKLAANTWIHIHCEAGEGRTTTFMSMIDMLHNAENLSYDEIMTRQVLLGGQDLRSATAKDPVKKEGYLRRALFTKHFYDYVKANPELVKSWNQWAKEHKY
jgi:hypothetical protein